MSLLASRQRNLTEYTKRITNRVNYLKHEEEAMKRKISKKVSEVERLYQMREEKISNLEQRLRLSTSKMSSLQKLKEGTRDLREQAEM